LLICPVTAVIELKPGSGRLLGRFLRLSKLIASGDNVFGKLLPPGYPGRRKLMQR
jgi:hypothetical protein